MNRQAFIIAAILVAPIQPLSAAGASRRATIVGGGNGKCTIEVNVDGSAEVEIFGNTGQLTTFSGREAIWHPGDFRLIGVDGRGRVQLVRDPRNNRGRAVVRIDDPNGGREGYTFDLQ